MKKLLTYIAKQVIIIAEQRKIVTKTRKIGGITMTTKEQERQAIAKVRKIVEGMGGNSYLATAMEGVLEIAEENIECDAAFSIKGRADLAEKEAAKLKEDNEGLQNQLEREKEHSAIMLKRMVTAEKQAALWKMPEWMQSDLFQIIENKRQGASETAKLAADNMAGAVKSDGNIEESITKWAEMYREQEVQREKYNRILSVLERYKEEESK